MVYRVGINGFGRIGRQTFKAITQGNFGDLFEVVAVNDLAPAQTLATLLKYDSTYGRFDAEIDAVARGLRVNGRRIAVSAEKEPQKIRWGSHDVDVVVESTGLFTKAADADGHIEAGAQKVIISAPAKGEDITIVLGVNEAAYDPDEHDIISNASCTTNCLAPVAKVILDNFGIKRGMMTTVHSYTNDQVTLDGPHKDPRRARSAAQNIIPTSTGAAKAVELVIPELKGKFDGTSLRVPTATVSIIDFVVETDRDTTAKAVNDAFREAAKSDHLQGILGYSDEPLVSSDFRGDSRSAVIDGLSTMALGDNLIKVLAWYDNEWAYACRVAEVVALVCERGIASDEDDEDEDEAATEETE
jgi:glyceraldehyde 3-phosphate dehydrogenase